MNKPIFAISSLVLASFAIQGSAYSATPAAQSQTFTTQQNQAIENIISNYLDSHPEIIEKALKKAFLKKEQAKQEKTKQVIVQRKSQIFKDPMSPTSGNANGTTEIAVFMDPFCGYCHQFQKILNDVQSQRKDLRVVYKIVPFLSKESLVAAREEMAAHLQDRFVEYHEALYESTARAQNQKSRMELAREVGININRLKKDIRSSKVKRAIEANQELAKALSIGGTPAFIVNDTLVVGLVDADNLNKILDAKSEITTPS
ncbi:MAG: DsbA family protein [Pseudomonadota bacterium]